MARYFDERAWRQAIKQPDWYVQLHDELERLSKRWDALEDAGKHDEASAMKKAVRGFFTDALQAGEVALGSDGQNFDDERKPIDTIVIHHTSGSPGYELPYMNATQMLNIYAPRFYEDAENLGLRGKGLWSNHVRDGRPIFIGYHWFMRMDGSFERILEDKELGWHAANWDINCRSVGICLDNDYEAQDPSAEVIETLAAFITAHYPQVERARIVGHGEVSNHPTTCPGGNFTNGWKKDLLTAVG